MSDGIWVALSGAVAQSSVLESTAADLANAATDGYQRRRPVFREVMAGQELRYTVAGNAAVDGSPGSRRPTGRGLDAALPQGVYLAVQTPRGERYTRACSLSTSADGTLRSTSGDPVVGEDGAPLRATAGQGDVTLTPEGEVRQGGGVLGRLRLVSFARPENLTPEGATLMGVGGAGAATPARGTLDVGALEESNASVVTAMTDLVSATRTFEAFQRVIDAYREADRKVTTEVPRAR